MKKTILGFALLTCLLPSIASAFVYPCDGTPGAYHTNPDNSEGGATVTISPDATVCGRASVLSGAVISDRAVISGRAVVKEEVVVSGRAKVYGEATVENTGKVYGNALVHGTAVITVDQGWGEWTE